VFHDNFGVLHQPDAQVLKLRSGSDFNLECGGLRRFGIFSFWLASVAGAEQK